ncbi:MAG: hypothetical protein ABJA81_04370 [Nocardioidaceae bacterium]
MKTSTLDRSFEPARSAASLVSCATALAVAGTAWLAWLAQQPTRQATAETVPHGVTAWLLSTLLALPVVIGGVWVASRLDHRVREELGSTTITGLLRPVLISGAAAIGVGVGWQLQTTIAGTGPPADRLLIAITLASPITMVATLVLAAATTGSLRFRPPSFRKLLTSVASVAVVFATAAFPLGHASTAEAAGSGPCPDGATPKQFDIQAINVNIPLNRFGDHDPKGLMTSCRARSPRCGPKRQANRCRSGCATIPSSHL